MTPSRGSSFLYSGFMTFFPSSLVNDKLGKDYFSDGQWGPQKLVQIVSRWKYLFSRTVMNSLLIFAILSSFDFIWPLGACHIPIKLRAAS